MNKEDRFSVRLLSVGSPSGIWIFTHQLPAQTDVLHKMHTYVGMFSSMYTHTATHTDAQFWADAINTFEHLKVLQWRKLINRSQRRQTAFPRHLHFIWQKMIHFLRCKLVSLCVFCADLVEVVVFLGSEQVESRPLFFTGSSQQVVKHMVVPAEKVEGKILQTQTPLFYWFFDYS